MEQAYPTPEAKQRPISAKSLEQNKGEKSLEFVMPLEGLIQTPNKEILVKTKDGKSYILSLEDGKVMVSTKEGLGGTLDEVCCDGLSRGDVLEFATSEGEENLTTAAITEMVERDRTS